MIKNAIKYVAIAGLLSLPLASSSLAASHDMSKMNHGGGQHDMGSMMPADHGVEIKKIADAKFSLTFNLIDNVEAMKKAGKMSDHAKMTGMKSNHLMVFVKTPDGKDVLGAKVGYVVVNPDKSEQKAMAMEMTGGYGADVDLAAKGDYTIKTKVVLGNETSIQEFVYKVK